MWHKQIIQVFLFHHLINFALISCIISINLVTMLDCPSPSLIGKLYVGSVGTIKYFEYCHWCMEKVAVFDTVKILLYKYWDLHSVNSPNKNSLSLMRSYLIGHTIFLTSEKYCMTNQKPDTIFFTSEKIRECLLRSLPLPESWLQGLHTLNRWNNLSRTKKTKIQERKLNRMLLCLRNFWCLGTSQDLRRNSPKGAECIAKLIITVRKKDSNEYYEPSSLRSFMASFDWYLKKKN